jgi:hypothetical protein
VYVRRCFFQSFASDQSEIITTACTFSLRCWRSKFNWNCTYEIWRVVFSPVLKRTGL